MRRIVALVMLLTVAITQCGWSSPLFRDVNKSHWAADAVAELAAKGIIEGYPDGTFKGDRRATRWEMAAMIARLLSLMEKEHATFATKEDYQTVKALADEYAKELEAFGIRVMALEEGYSKLENRIDTLEHITLYGSWDTIMLREWVTGDSNMGFIANPTAIDWTNGRPIINGKAYTSALRLGSRIQLAPNYQAGVEIAGYTSMGDVPVDHYWGVTAPYLSNPWTATGSAIPGQQPANNQPFTRVNVDSAWIQHTPTGTTIALGAFYPRVVEPYVLAGERNPAVTGPSILPFFGLVANGKIHTGKWQGDWEMMGSRLAQSSLYNTWVAATALGLDFAWGRLAVNFMRAVNERVTNGTVQAANAILIPFNALVPPGSSFWVDTRTATARTTVGPQEESTLGASALVKAIKNLKVLVEWAASLYDPDTIKAVGAGFNTKVGGNMFRANVNWDISKRWNATLDWIRVAENYDPFLLAYPTPTGIPVFLPYATYYPNYYQLHDYLAQPNNRQGPTLTVTYTYPRGSAYVTAQVQSQVSATTPLMLQSVGSIEPLYPLLTGGGTETGSSTSWGVGGNYQLPDSGWLFNGSYYNYKLRRASNTAADDIDFQQNVYGIGVAYPVNRKLSVMGNFNYVGYKGHSGLTNQDFIAQTPSLGASYSLDANTSVTVQQKWYQFQRFDTTGLNWHATQTEAEFKVNF